MARPKRSTFIDAVRSARRRKRPILAFNFVDLASLMAVLEAASEVEQPVIAQASARTVKFYGANAIGSAFREARARNGATAFLHLDHCNSDTVLADAIDAGFDGVMADGSHLSLEENMRWSRHWRERATRAGVLLEAEITPIAGEEDGFTAASAPHDVSDENFRKFCDRVQPDFVGADIGTHHGHYASTPVLNYRLLRSLVAPRLPAFVVHGGSGLSPATLRKLVALGVVKFNFSTDLKTAWLAGIHSGTERDAREPLAALQLAHSQVKMMALKKWRAVGETK